MNVYKLSSGSSGHLKKSDPPVGFEPHYLHGKLMGRCWWFWLPSFDGNFNERTRDEVAQFSVSWFCWYVTLTRWPWSRKHQRELDAGVSIGDCATATKARPS